MLYFFFKERALRSICSKGWLCLCSGWFGNLTLLWVVLLFRDCSLLVLSNLNSFPPFIIQTVVQAKYCSSNVLFSWENDEFNAPVCLYSVLRNWPFALKWHVGYSSIFKDTMSHRNGWRYVNEIFTVGRAHIKHSITSVIIKLVADLIFLIFFWNTV